MFVLKQRQQRSFNNVLEHDGKRARVCWNVGRGVLNRYENNRTNNIKINAKALHESFNLGGKHIIIFISNTTTDDY